MNVVYVFKGIILQELNLTTNPLFGWVGGYLGVYSGNGQKQIVSKDMIKICPDDLVFLTF